MTVNHSVSDPLPVISGVPQGSILGPLLFLIFVNDLPSSIISSKVYLFADDTKCRMPMNDLSAYQSFQKALDHLSAWSRLWNLPFNEHKCILLRFHSGCQPHLKEEEVEEENQCVMP